MTPPVPIVAREALDQPYNVERPERKEMMVREIEPMEIGLMFWESRMPKRPFEPSTNLVFMLDN